MVVQGEEDDVLSFTENRPLFIGSDGCRTEYK